MKIAFVLLTVISCAASFSFGPVGSVGASKVDRRGAVEKVLFTAAGAAFVAGGVPGAALADGSVSTATRARARGVYGTKIAELKQAVKAGDFKAIVEQKNAFILFNSGALVKNQKADAVEATNQIFAAIRAQDKGALQASYDSYVKKFDITDLPDNVNDKSGTQGYSTDYDYRARTKAGTIYVR